MQMVHGFMTTPIDSQHTEFHVNLAQSILDICLQHTPLQDELFCLLIKQTSRHPSHRKSGVRLLFLVNDYGLSEWCLLI
jgi:hypothetical protein